MVSKIKKILIAGSLATCYLLVIALHDVNAQSDSTKDKNIKGASGISTDPAIISQGESLFTNNCTSCHQVSNEVVVGPGLKGVHERRPLAWLISFIKNSQKLIQSGDKYAVELYKKYNQTMMPTHDFTDAQIGSIIAYIQSESTKQPVAKTGDTTTSTGISSNNTQSDDGYVSIVLISFVVILALIIVILLLIISVLTKYLNQRPDLDEEDRKLLNIKFDFSQLLRSKPFIGIVLFIFIAIVAKASLDGLYNVGVTQGYAPKQPIAFSHKLHVGQYKVDCNYCHTGVRKSKSATIPSINVCMNCHNTIKTESPEIKKLYTAIENNKPIEWVRVHNLPDLAYFNHSQHVTVGGVECQTCHGPLEKMELVQQYAPLTMGWCINCHRETDVNGQGNAYYTRLLENHAKFHKKDNMKVVDIGGLECARCHY